MLKKAAVIKIVGIFVLAAIAGSFFFFSRNSQPPKTLSENQRNEASTSRDLTAIRNFMGKPDLELKFIETGLPQPYFMVGKVFPLEKDGGFRTDKVDGWIRQVNIYEQKELVSGQCSVYEYHTDARNHVLTSVRIRNLRQNEIDNLSEKDKSACEANSQMPKITKAEAETLAMDYLKRALPDFDQIKDQFIYTSITKSNVHEWKWEDKNYKLPEGLGGDPYSYPIIRIAIYGDKSILYENTTSLFEN
jgi:hypothetical protein